MKMFNKKNQNQIITKSSNAGSYLHFSKDLNVFFFIHFLMQYKAIEREKQRRKLIKSRWPKG